MKKQVIFPAAATLVGTTHFPKVDNQGSIGSCASQAITYDQFTNAFSRYTHSVEDNGAWCPRDINDHRFTPRFTYNLSGAGTKWVYETLMDHGCLTCKDYSFKKDEKGGSMLKEKDGSYCKDSSAWPTKEGMMEKALHQRVLHFRQEWFTNEPYNGQMTTTEAGRALLSDIKESINRGDCVVTGGFLPRWVYGRVEGCGTYGKIGDQIVVASSNEGGFGHQIAIVGYDDEITSTYNGVKLKGAFQIVNSWSETWMNGGFVWLMYDAMNVVSAYEELNDPKLFTGKMYLTPNEGMAMYSTFLAKENQLLTFKKAGSTEIYGKKYDAFKVYDKMNDKHLYYEKDPKERELFFKTEEEAKENENKGELFAFIPYKDLMNFETSKKDYYKEDYEGSYWIYAVERDGNEDCFRVLDAGVGFTGSGRKVNFATLNAGRYPEAKSWTVEGDFKDEFDAKLMITAGKNAQSGRGWALDQFCFLDYTKDVTTEMPKLYVRATIEATDRNCFSVHLTRRRKDGKVPMHYEPAMFRYTPYHPAFRDNPDKNYLNFDGELNGKMATGYFVFHYEPLMKFKKGEDVSDFFWGIELKKGRKGKAKLLECELVNGEGTVLYKVKPENNKTEFQF